MRSGASSGTIDSGKLTTCQKDAAIGLYAEAMGGYLQWMAENFEERRAALFDRVAVLRIHVLNTR